MGTQAFDIDAAMDRVREAVRPYPKAGMFELHEEGFRSPFELLAACIISIRTFDEVMLTVARKLFARARAPREIAAMSVDEIDRLISECTFHERKAAQIHEIARRIVDDHQGLLPCDRDVLLSFNGVGPKCANLVLGIACNEPRVGVDIHVHRVTNRWGYVKTDTPERTMEELEAKLPHRYWVEINKLLVPFGKHICTGSSPRCAACPLSDMCLQVGVLRR
ncbi:MAG: endonuclease III [Acidobacteriota bacterium]